MGNEEMAALLYPLSFGFTLGFGLNVVGRGIAPWYNKRARLRKPLFE